MTNDLLTIAFSVRSESITRRQYFTINLFTMIVCAAALVLISHLSALRTLYAGAALVLLAVLLTLTMFLVGIVTAVQRLRDVGGNPWWSLLIIFPYANLFLF